MVQPSFSNPDRQTEETAASPTAPLDAFLNNQHQSYYEELYRSEAVCLSVLRLLPPITRHIVLHVLWSYTPLKATELKALCQISPTANLTIAEEILRPAMDRKIFHPVQMKKGHMQWPMNDTFKRGLRNAMTGLGTSNSFGVPAEPEEDAPSFEELMQFGESTWESILKWMVSSGLDDNALATARPSDEVLELLLASGLMTYPLELNPKHRTLNHLTITSKGFQFLLEDRQTQMWQILMFSLTLKEANLERSAEVLSVFFSLGCMQLGQAYSATNSFPHVQHALSSLQQYGFIAFSRDAPDTFYPTHLATSLLSGDVAALTSATGGDDKRFLILETNYKVYAYTSNELEIAILNLFTDIRIRYKNFVVGKLDRKHVKRAMEKGINAYQIIAYLTTHAHPQMHNSPPPLLHTTITDQLHLWDKERNRLKVDDAVMFEFFSKELYEDTLAEAKRYDAVLFNVPEKKLLFIDPSIKDAVRDFVKGQQMQLRGG